MRAAGALERPFAKLDDEVRFFRNWNEQTRADAATLLVLPAHQRLGAGHLPRPEVDEGHVDEPELFFVERRGELLEPRSHEADVGIDESDQLAARITGDLFQGRVDKFDCSGAVGDQDELGSLLDGDLRIQPRRDRRGLMIVLALGTVLVHGGFFQRDQAIRQAMTINSTGRPLPWLSLHSGTWVPVTQDPHRWKTEAQPSARRLPSWMPPD